MLPFFAFGGMEAHPLAGSRTNSYFPKMERERINPGSPPDPREIEEEEGLIGAAADDEEEEEEVLLDEPEDDDSEPDNAPFRTGRETILRFQ
ncbi:MAG TPA: hypothetical protein PKB01_09100, partial [Xanthobacteraceae bacterium]|nr:hypothetical protein [Xanthobacteraceae bacterium]